MLPHVGQRFLNDANELQLHGHGQSEVVVDLHLRGESALLFPALQILLKNLGQGLTPGRQRAKSDDRLAHVGVRLARRRGELGELCGGLLALAAAEIRIGRLHFRVHVAQDLGDAVVHLVGDAQPLLRHSQAGHLRMQVGVVDGDGRLDGEALQRLFVVVAEQRVVLLLGQIEIAEKRALAGDGNGEQRAHGGMVGREAG